LFSANTGPPLLPELIAASIWTHSSSADPWAYDDISMRETTPAVMAKFSPPRGYPTTVTES